jgi:protein-S-isoprenylcysteine O-methyltransferase Ste14
VRVRRRGPDRGRDLVAVRDPAAFSLACGFGHVLPYLYVSFLTVLLVYRGYRDDLRCREKYGRAWDDYCTRVPYRMIPGIW